ncbi:virion structural protein [Pseudomonas phage Psa21]|uniref:Virion structural protein n=1 Tax=Pseudomonas phage Psa21 TaxID=2530023 RepID=A0A481W562_9CAUD|nr:virion structural protein [Pseudomonas phage Psa21]QBJ02625.1 virion structural protein [Pseudomonas phage Psa21]
MSQYTDRIYNARRNPSQMQQIALEELDQQLQGRGTYDIPDASIPFVASMECGTLGVAMAITEMEAQMRMLNARMALTQDEVYYHMSTDDYIGRFSTPATTDFHLYLGYEEIIQKAVPYGDQGARKLIIPRLTQFMGGTTPFTMQYPIELRVLRHGGLQIVYDGTSVSPIETLKTNQVSWDMLRMDRNRVIRLKIPVRQFRITTNSDALSPATLFENSYTFTDKFYFARVYLNDGASSEWTEVLTTHTEQVYNPLKVTAVLRVVGQTLQVAIPTIYTNTGLASGKIRVDIYTTLGQLDLSMADYRPEQFQALFNAIDDDTTYVSPLNTFSIKQALNVSRVTGGANALDFITIRNRAIDNTMGDADVPITDVQLEAKLDQRGYTLVSNIDNITDRQFLASRRLGTPQALDVVSGAGCVMSQLRINMDMVAASAHTADNGERITILPSMLYRFSNGKVTMVQDAELASIVTSDPEDISRLVNESRFVYSPFHYVMDATDSNFDFRPYYLDNPTITEKTFVGENESSNLQSNVDAYEIERVANGYRILVRLVSSAQFRSLDDSQVVCQIGYRPTGEEVFASVNGRQIGIENSERVFEFLIETNYDLDNTGELYTTNMSIFSSAQTNFKTKLENEFDISILVVNAVTPGYQSNTIDAMVQSHLLPNEWMLVNRERLEITLGYDMSRIWRRNRSVLGEEDYQRWTENVPKYWTENQYRKDATGHDIIEIGPNGQVIMYLEHAKGSPVLDAKGEQTWLHLKNDPVMVDGKPVLAAPRKLLREVTILMVDGLFYFATEAAAVAYRKEIPMEFVTWLQSDIGDISERLLEKAELYVYPTQTFGDTVVSTRDGQQATIRIDQSFAITHWLKPAAYTNSTIRPSLIDNDKQVLDSQISRKTISNSEIVAQLGTTAGDDVLANEISGLGGDENYPILTVDDDAVRLSIRKKMVVLANQLLTIEDDVTVNFLPHEQAE